MAELTQDLSQQQEQGLVFMMRLLFDKETALPDREIVQEVMQKHLGDVDIFSCDSEMIGLAAKRYEVEFKEGKAPPMLMITSCFENDNSFLGPLERSQMWDCPESEELLDSCRWSIAASDMLAGALDTLDRAELEMDYMEALAELFPECRGFYFASSGKLFTAEAIRSHSIPREDRFIYFAVNVRFFNIEGTEDMLVDSLGMNILFMPDLQYHFHGTDPNFVVNHAYNVLSYLMKNDCPIETGHTVDGFGRDGRMTPDIQWVCRYEDALIQPARPVIDIEAGEYASGGRNYEE
ncbi:MAG: DUF4261 domain-containing protein [Ruminococcus sp.]|nr:DUF4261 domain-containing protein [Ruminococcus sp.]